MIKRAFGMACLNITQGRFTQGSHSNLNAVDLGGSDTGIDKFIATYRYKVTKVLSLGSTGYANTVLMYDEENDVTLAFTHINNLLSSHVVGHVYEIGDTIYLEGTAGNSTGNHIHLEIGKGYQTEKPKDKYGHYALLNLINIEDYFYIEDTTSVKNAGGYVFDKKLSKIDLSNVKFVESNGSVLLLSDINVQDIKGNVVYNAKKGEYLPLIEDNKISQDFIDGNKWCVVRLPDWNWGYIRIDDNIKLEF